MFLSMFTIVQTNVQQIVVNMVIKKSTHFQSLQFEDFSSRPPSPTGGGKLETDPTSSMLHQSIQSDGLERELGRPCTGQQRDANHLNRDVPPIWQKECCAAWVFWCCNLNNSMLIAEARLVGFLGQGTGTRSVPYIYTLKPVNFGCAALHQKAIVSVVSLQLCVIDLKGLKLVYSLTGW